MSEKLSPFDIASNINNKSGQLDVNEVGFDAFVVNRVFSNTRDSIFFANEMNQCYNLPKDMQYQFYYHGLPKKSRYGKWNKNQDDKSELEVIQDYFGYSRNKAKQVQTLLRPHLDGIRLELEKGGRHRHVTK
jgi:hypothetical protein